MKKAIIFFVASLITITVGYSQQTKANNTGSVSRTEYISSADALYSKHMHIADEIALRLNNKSNLQLSGGLFMINIPGPELNKEASKFIIDNSIRGVILMGGNISDALQTQKLVRDIKSIKPNILVAIDQEGGSVVRMKWDKFASLSARIMAEKGLEDIRIVHLERAKLLQENGFDLVFAPVLDLGMENSWIKDRAFSEDAEEVAQVSEVIVSAMKQYSILTTAKHFPGLGRAVEDTHEVLPVLNIPRNEQDEDIRPFSSFIKNKGELVMTSHAVYQQLDSDNPASLSKRIVSEMLREDLKFDGIVITDDLRMGALNKIDNKFIKALEAGNNILLYIDYLPKTQKAIDEIAKLDKSYLYDRASELERRLIQVGH